MTLKHNILSSPQAKIPLSIPVMSRTSCITISPVVSLRLLLVNFSRSRCLFISWLKAPSQAHSYVCGLRYCPSWSADHNYTLILLLQIRMYVLEHCMHKFYVDLVWRQCPHFIHGGFWHLEGHLYNNYIQTHSIKTYVQMVTSIQC